jgi:hypothetical protein
VKKEFLMDVRRFAIIAVTAGLVAFAGCATSPEDERRRQDMEADIDEILGYELDEAEYGKPKNCLSTHEYRSFRALGDRHLLFEGRNDKLWVNVLRGRCPGLDDNSKFIMKQNMSGRVCDTDLFEVMDRFDPISSAAMGPTCILGEFRPVSKAQVAEIEDRLEMR